MNGQGTIEIEASGGVPPYLYSINGSEPVANNIIEGDFESGTYTIEVMDVNGCKRTKNFSFNRCAGILLDIFAFIDISGNINVEAEGGTPPYEYSLDGMNFQSEAMFVGDYQTGDYLVVVRDSNGCQYQNEFSLFRNGGNHQIFNISLSPASPATIVGEDWVRINFDYTKAMLPETVLIGVKPLSNDHYLTSSSPGYTESSGSSGGPAFRRYMPTEEVTLKKIRVYMVDTTPERNLLFDVYIDVDYTFVPQ
jgi:hypothetical protein